MKPVPKQRRSLLETSENIVIKSELCSQEFMFTGNCEDEQKETESNKNKTTVDVSKEVVTEETKEEENSTSNVEILETESKEIGPETQRLLDIMTNESHIQAIEVVKKDSKNSVVEIQILNPKSRDHQILLLVYTKGIKKII